MPKIIFIEDDKRVLENLKNTLDHQRFPEQSTLDKVPKTEKELDLPKTPSIVFLGPSLKTDKALELSRMIRRNNPLNTVILSSAQASTELLKAAMQNGIFEVIDAGASSSELEAALDRAKEFLGQITTDEDKVSVTETGKAKIISLFSAKGGAGKSFLAINLAASIGAATGKTVAILDLDLAFGDIAVMLSVFPQRTIFDAAEVEEKLDSDMLDGFLSPTKLDNIRVMPAPVEPEQAELISQKTITKILNLLSEMVDYLIIDTPAKFSDHTLAALDRSDLIIMLASMDVPSIKNTKITLRILDELEYKRDKFVLILNRANSEVGLTTKEIARTLNFDIDGTIPSDRAVPQSVNRGIPLVKEYPKSPAAKNIAAISDMLLKRLHG